MIRRAFTMRLKPGAMAEYRRYHDEIWPDLVAEVERSGIGHISTFEADPVLFLFSEIEDEEAWTRLWDSEIHRRWGEVMEQFMEFKDGKVDAGPLNEIFHLETDAGGRAAGRRRSGGSRRKTTKKPAPRAASRSGAKASAKSSGSKGMARGGMKTGTKAAKPAKTKSRSR